MNLAFYIARRYLFAKKKQNAINIISMISVCSVAITTTALVCVLSVFNGFNDLVASMFDKFDPELKITPAKGKVFECNTEAFRLISEMPEVAYFTPVLEDNVLVRYKERQQVAFVKGVDDSFRQLAEIDSLIIDGSFKLQEGETTFAVLGIGLASSLGVNAGFIEPLEVYAPKRDEKVNISNIATSFNLEYAFVSAVFCINQPVYDESYLILPIHQVRELLNYPTAVSAWELKLASGASVKTVQKEIKQILGSDFHVKDRFEQQETSFKMMQIEKWMTFLILAFILVIALFNVVSSISMLMIEKQDDVQMLRSMGANSSLIRQIFLMEGSMIPALGAVIGIIFGVILCVCQQQFGWLKLGNTVGAFVSDNYPVRIDWKDLFMIFMTVFSIGLLASWYPVRYLGRKWLTVQRLAAFILPLLLCGCGSKQQEGEGGIVVTIEPQRYFVEKIAGENFKVHTVVPIGQSPETYDPTPHEMIRIAEGKAYLQIGRIGFEEAWMKTLRANNPHLQFSDLSEGIQWIEGAACGGHHGEGHAHHHHGGVDPHIWSSTQGAKVMARNTLLAIESLDPDNKITYEENYQQFISEIEQTEASLHEMLDTLSARTFVIYHPALTYFANEYGLVQLAIESEGKEPSVSSMKDLIDQARKARVRVVFVQQEFDQKHAEQVAKEIGARVVPINPLDARWREQMLHIGSELVK